MKLKLGADFRDALRSFHTCGVKYLIIGGWAVSIHAQPRATQDMYIFVGSEKTNLEAVYEALLRCGAPPERVDRQQFLTPGSYYRIGVPPGQVDIFSRIPGVQFEACWPARVEVRLDDEDALL